MTDGQSATLSRCQAHIWGPRPDFYCCQTVSGLLMSGTLSGEATSLLFALYAGSRQRILRSKSCGTYDHILLSPIRDSPNLEGHVPVFISPRNWVGQLSPQALDSLFVTSYDSQGYGGVIQTRLYAGNRKHCSFDPCFTALGQTA
jgi:hypothetical protein